MADIDPRLQELVRRGREERNLEYKVGDARQPFEWGPNDVKEKIGRTVMAMANIGGGAIVIGMSEMKETNTWEPEGISDAVDATFQQDEISRWMDHRADPYVRLSIYHIVVDGRRFVVIDVAGFDELPVVCTSGTGLPQGLRPGAIYTRPFEMRATREVQSSEEMRQILDLAIERGVKRWLRPFEDLLRGIQVTSGVAPTQTNEEQQFQREHGEQL